MHRVVITGVGLITSVGIGVKEGWPAMLAGRDGAGDIHYFDTSPYKVHKAHLVKGLPVGTTPHELAIMTAREAIDDSGLDRLDQERTGLALGTLGGDLKTFETVLRKNAARKPDAFNNAVADTYPLSTIPQALSEEFGIEGPSMISINACSSGNHALAHAYDLLREGTVDVMLAGGVDVFAQTEFTYFHNLRALAPERCQPFDKNRQGLMIGEGSGMMVLETMDAASKRGARIYAEMIGYGLSSDGFHVTAPEPDGDGAMRAIRLALTSSGVSPEQIDYVNAHGTGTPANDKIETTALKAIFGDRAKRIPASSVKSMIGHTMGAASAIESVVCGLALREGVIPPTINYETPDPDCDLDYVPNRARELNMKFVLNNSFAFGGNNAVIVFRKV